MAEEAPKPRKRRLVKNPDSFRERAEKAGKTADKPKIVSRSFSYLLKPFKMLGSQLAKAFKWKPLAVALKPVRLIGKIIVPPYVRNSFKELKQVTWPTLKQSRQLTFAVLIFAIIFGATITLVDAGLSRIFKSILLK